MAPLLLVASWAVAVSGAPAPVLKAYGSDAANLFKEFRIPAALVAAASIKDAFALQYKPEELQSTTWRVTRDAYMLLQTTAFICEIGCVFISTHAIIQLLGDSEVTGSAMALLTSDRFEYEYVTVRASFTTGLLAFVCAQALRVRVALRHQGLLSWCATGPHVVHSHTVHLPASTRCTAECMHRVWPRCAMWSLFAAASTLLMYNNSEYVATRMPIYRES